MKKLITALSATMLVVFLSPISELNAQNNESNIEISLETYRPLSQNFIPEIGFTVDHTRRWGGNPPDGEGIAQNFEEGNTLNYEFEHAPVEFKNDPSLNFAMEIAQNLPDKNLTRGIKLSTSNFGRSINGITIPEDPGAFSWIQIWDANLEGVLNTNENNQRAKVNYWAEDDFNSWNIDIFAEKRLKSGDYNISVHSALRGIKSEYKVVIGQKQKAFYKYRMGNQDGIFTFENVITIQSEASSDMTMTGPSLGLSVERSFGPVSIEAKASRAILYTWADYSGEFHDTDEFVLTDNTGHEDEVLYDGWVRFNRDDNLWNSNTKLSLRAGTDWNNFSTNVGVLLNRWNDRPLVPELKRPWGLQNPAAAPGGMNWEIKKYNANMTSIFLSASYAIH